MDKTIFEVMVFNIPLGDIRNRLQNEPSGPLFLYMEVWR